MRIPKDTESAIARLTALDKLISVRQWERAAIVASMVRPQQGKRRPTSTEIRRSYSLTEFAALGIHGLTTRESVRAYLRAWELSGLDVPEYGADVPMPEISFPEITMLIDRNPSDMLKWALENLDPVEITAEDFELLQKSMSMFLDRINKFWDKLDAGQKYGLALFLEMMVSVNVEIIKRGVEESRIELSPELSAAQEEMEDSELDREVLLAFLKHDVEWPKHLERRRRVSEWGKKAANRKRAQAWLDDDNRRRQEVYDFNTARDVLTVPHRCHKCPDLPEDAR